MKKYKKGYTQGVYDMFHIGHLNIINNAKQLCEHLIVAVNSDELVYEYKHKTPVISEEQRRYIVENIKAVDEAVIAHTLDKVEQFKKYGFDVVFIGDDWKGSERWLITEKLLKEFDVDVVYLPHTNGISSTELRTVSDSKINE